MNEWQASPWLKAGVPGIALVLCALLFATEQRESVFLAFNSLGQVGFPGITALWENITLLGDSFTLFLFMLLLLDKHPQLIKTAALGALLTAPVSNLLKAWFQVMRPPAVLPLEQFQILGPTLMGNSMPSGHTMAAFLIAAVLLPLCRQRWQVWGLITLATLVGISRMVCGVHWPTDVTAGAAIGWSCGLLAHWLAVRWTAGDRLGMQRFFALLLAGNAVWVLFFYHCHYDAAEPLKTLIALSCCALALPAYRRLFFRSATPAANA